MGMTRDEYQFKGSRIGIELPTPMLVCTIKVYMPNCGSNTIVRDRNQMKKKRTVLVFDA